MSLMEKDQWFGFFAAGGRLSLSDWIELGEADRDLAVEAGQEYRDDVIGNIGKASQNLLYALHLMGAKEEIEESLHLQFFSEFRNMKAQALEEHKAKARDRKAG
jgi:hypothetical protein